VIKNIYGDCVSSTLIIGSGNISKHLKQDLSEVHVIPLRRVLDSLELVGRYKKVIFLGYDHYSVLRNIYIYLKVVLFLNKRNFNGIFIFLNTQGVELKNITLQPYGEYLHFNRYIITKRFQSRILKLANFKTVNLYFPLVYGMGNGLDCFVESVSSSNSIEFPNKANNRFYFLNVKKLVTFLYSSNINAYSTKKHIKGYLIYSDYLTFSSFVMTRSGHAIQAKHNKYQNMYNLDKLDTIQYIVKNRLRNLLSLIWYTLPFSDYLNNNTLAINSREALDRLSPEQNKFYSLTFIDPKEISIIGVIKL
jgi:hypothetical protein